MRRTSSTVRLSGSSPRLRGTRMHAAQAKEFQRFIPAPAGNTSAPVPRPRPVPVHPRACGEHLPDGLHVGGSLGSSPRLRGTPVMRTVIRLPLRFIPAPAGNTIVKPILSSGISVHPRACGEHRSGFRRRRPVTGSSPRLRGTLERQRGRNAEFRFIPAPAGNTRVETSPGRAEAVHPRACGEHTSHFRASTRMRGSSPRLRGTRKHPQAGFAVHRFIPAPAGNTARCVLRPRS